jgi:LysR family transcriptional regulator, glycine cleavage system transcriptional activator
MGRSSSPPPDRVPYPPLASLEAVRAVAGHQSLTGSVGELGLTAGALSRRVVSIEAWLGTPLFERHGRGMRPPPDGQCFLSRIEEAFALIEMAADPWRGRKGSDVVRVSVVPSFARLWLLPRLRGLELEPDGGPCLRIEVAVDYRHADVEDGEVEVAIRYGQGTWKGVEAEPLMPERLVPVAHPDLAARLGQDAGPADLLRQALLCVSDAVGWRAWLRARCRALSPAPARPPVRGLRARPGRGTGRPRRGASPNALCGGGGAGSGPRGREHGGGAQSVDVPCGHPAPREPAGGHRILPTASGRRAGGDPLMTWGFGTRPDHG